MLRANAPIPDLPRYGAMSPVPQTLLETSLVVADLDRARAFYERVFGFGTVIADDDLVGLQLANGAVLLLFPVAGVGTAEHGAFAPHVRFAVPHGTLQAWDRHLMMNGIVVESRVMGLDGASSLFFRDPDQNSLEVAAEGS